jgi:glycosyltransferase involved in cell wall biosynthesis
VTQNLQIIKVVHIIPFNGIGGVESAANSLAEEAYGKFKYSKVYLVNDLSIQDELFIKSINNPINYWKSFRYLVELKPDILIASLWRSYLLVIIFKILFPKTRTITFLHFPKAVHIMDWVFAEIAIMLSSEVWTDSQITLERRISAVRRRKTRVISFLTQRLKGVRQKIVSPTFMFWGRLHPQKNLIATLNIFSSVYAHRQDAQLHIVGPDGGDKKKILKAVNNLGLQTCVRLYGPMKQSEIFNLAENVSFYLQTSVEEGMAMSVVEAMQLGLVPIVTPVGAIASYCQHKKNALLVYSKHEVLSEILKLLDNQEEFTALSSSAILAWKDIPLYSDSVIDALKNPI